jgi:NAD(P)-dependent dehydrogenase (short-subunit alcohol dehydrogenase family)
MGEYLRTLFSLDGKVAVVTGGTGVLGAAMARGLADVGARVGVLGRRLENAGGEAVALSADVLRREDLEGARDSLLKRWGRVDILVNAAGGNMPAATLQPGTSIFDLPLEGLEQAIDLNLIGTILPSQIFGAAMVQRPSNEPASGCIINISSLSAHRVLTRVVGYSIAKTGVEKLTQWLAVELARMYGEGMRVNAIAPGFFLGEQNRSLLTNEDGGFSPRGQTIIDHTPMGRFGEPDDLLGALIWLCSPSARFVTGTVVIVDGGFDAFSGV